VIFMTTDTHPAAFPRPAAGAAQPVRHYAPLRNLVLVEAKLARREPTGLVFGVGVPMLILIIFGSVPSLNQPQDDLGGISVLTAYQPILIALCLAVFAFVAVPVPLAAYREQGVLRRMAATPVSPARVLAAHLIVNFASAVVSLLLLLGVGRFAFHMQLPRQAPGFALAYLLTVAALFAIGLWLSAIAPTGKIAQAFGAGLFYPLLFLGGLWLPRAEMSAGLRTVSDYSPLGAAVQAMQNTISGTMPPTRFLLVLVGYAAVFGYAAVRQFAWE
jgi:ABC-2 type transport system permease protein